MDHEHWTLHSEGSDGYWYENILGLKEVPPAGADQAGVQLVEVEYATMKWNLVGSLFFTWIVIYLSVSFGKSILADITYVTVLAPVVLIGMLLNK